MIAETSKFPVIRGHTIHVDERGFVCLNDNWRAAGFSARQTPAEWKGLPSTGLLIIAMLERHSGRSGPRNYNPASVIVTRKGKGGGVFAVVHLAIKYAEYLNAKFALEVADVFLRYKVADPTLADEVLERASPEANEWAAKRALARAGRRPFTDTLQRHGVRARMEFARCTDAVYIGLFRKTARQLKSAEGVDSNLRDAMDGVELTFVAAGEALARERIEQTNCQGAVACEAATLRSTSFLRDALEAERRDRVGAQQSLVLPR
ncbi:KilA-N domain-containing protein [Phenylobacterium sp.]|uniref:KilA-N domain-containing protein n=1 Tax=Phenylobacterium sp. TaxID=1871053 RepID=UPI002ED8FCAE